MGEELIEDGDDSLVGVFDDVVAGVFKFVDVCLRKEIEESIQESRSEAPVSHSPNQADRRFAELGETVFDSSKCGIARVLLGKRNVGDETVYGEAVGP